MVCEVGCTERPTDTVSMRHRKTPPPDCGAKGKDLREGPLKDYSTLDHKVVDSLRDAKTLAVFCILLRHADDLGVATITRRGIADALGYSASNSVDPALKSLREQGVIEVTPRWQDSTGKIVSEGGAGKIQLTNAYKISGALWQ